MTILDSIKDYFRQTRKVSTYNNSPLDTFRLISSPTRGESYNLGNCIKYITRYLATDGVKKRNPDCLMKVCHYAYFEMVRLEALSNATSYKLLLDDYVDKFENRKIRFMGTDLTLLEAMELKVGETMLNDLIFNCDCLDQFKRAEDYFLIGYFLLQRYCQDNSDEKTAIIAWNLNTNQWEVRGEEGEYVVDRSVIHNDKTLETISKLTKSVKNIGKVSIDTINKAIEKGNQVVDREAKVDRSAKAPKRLDAKYTKFDLSQLPELKVDLDHNKTLTMFDYVDLMLSNRYEACYKAIESADIDHILIIRDLLNRRIDGKL